MPHDILIRNVPDETYKALSELKPPELTQTEFLRGVLDDAVLDSKQLSIFQNRTPPQQTGDKTHFKFIDLFAGIGGFRCAMTAVGGECVFTSEWDKHAVKTYKEWYRTDSTYMETSHP